MASLDAALNRLAIAIDALESRLPSALAAGKVPRETGEELAKLRAERSGMQEEMDRLRAEVRALDDLHDDISAKLDNAIREVQLVIAE
jgi:predicted nuclease with TOPRIM domain